MKPKEMLQVKSEPVQLSLPATDDVHFVLNCTPVYCTCCYREPNASKLLCAELPWLCSPECACGGRLV